MQQSTIQPPISQHPPITPDRAKAALGNATLLQSFLLPKAPQTPQNAPQPMETPKPEVDVKGEIQGSETRLMSEITKLKDMIEANAPKDKNKELDDLKKEIEKVLSQSDDNTPTET